MLDHASASPVSFFYAAEQRGWPRDRLFRVYLNERMIAGACVAGQVREEPAFWVEFARRHWAVRWILFPFIKRILLRRFEREAMYAHVDPFAPTLHQLDRRNFQIKAAAIRRIRFQHKHLRDVQQSFGIVTIWTLDGRKRRLVALGLDQPYEIIERLRLLDRGLEVEGVDPYRTPHERDLAYALRDWQRAGIASICLGVGAAIVWATLWADRRMLLLAGVCTVGGALAMREAARMRRRSEIAHHA